jgi:hypothetical protein
MNDLGMIDATIQNLSYHALGVGRKEPYPSIFHKIRSRRKIRLANCKPLAFKDMYDEFSQRICAGPLPCARGRVLAPTPGSHAFVGGRVAAPCARANNNNSIDRVQMFR